MRVIAGCFRGRQVQTTADPGYRPVTGKVRESVFSMLESLGVDWGRVRVADIFAGSGSLGIEALSRGALSVTFMEKTNQATTLIRKNMLALGVPRSHWSVAQGDALRFLQNPAFGPWELVFLDPPYGQNLCVPALDLIMNNDKLTPMGLICAEVEASLVFTNSDRFNLTLLRDRLYGQTRMCIWRKN